MREILPLAVSLCLGFATADLLAAELPAPGEAQFVSGNDVKTLILKDFIRFDSHYLEHREQFGDRLVSLGQRLADLQAAGYQMECSNEIYFEAKWLHGYTADWDRLEKRLVDLATSLNQLDQDFATHQSPETGLWGACYTESFFKVEATALALIQLETMGEPPRFEIHLPHPFDKPPIALEHFNRLLVSDIAHKGVDNRGELGNISTVAGLAFIKDYIQDYLNNKVVFEGIRPGAEVEQDRLDILRYMQAWQDPVSGYWGPWYLSLGQYYKTADLSFTFHIVSYRHGQVDHWPEIVQTTLAIENDPYPFGWKHAGGFTNHNNYDVAKLFSYGWPHMSSEQKNRAASDIRDMLRWTLTSSLQTNGSFKYIPTFFDSVGADFYFGVMFLHTIGFWDPTKRFWTEQDFPEAGAICMRIKARLVAMALKSQESETALTQLENSC